MLALLSVAAIFALVHAQHNDGQYNHQQWGTMPIRNNNQQQAPSNYQAPNNYQAPSNYQSNAVQTGNRGAAPVHYVNIGSQLNGDYKFGYEAADGAFREETRNPDGSVSGQYGYVDANGQKRIVKYRAGKDGFMAEGDGIEKPAPAAAPQAPQQQYNAPQQNYNQQQYNPPQQNYNQYSAPQYSGSQQQYSVQAPQQNYNGYPFTYITHQNQPQQQQNGQWRN